jgi:hypothetical protein
MTTIHIQMVCLAAILEDKTPMHCINGKKERQAARSVKAPVKHCQTTGKLVMNIERPILSRFQSPILKYATADRSSNLQIRPNQTKTAHLCLFAPSAPINAQTGKWSFSALICLQKTGKASCLKLFEDMDLVVPLGRDTLVTTILIVLFFTFPEVRRDEPVNETWIDSFTRNGSRVGVVRPQSSQLVADWQSEEGTRAIRWL